MLKVEQKDFYTTTVDNTEYCDTKQFLFQDIYSHVFILSKRGIGKTYSVYRYILDSVVTMVKEDLVKSLKRYDSEPVKLPLNVGFILANMRYNSSLILTLNEMLNIYFIEEYVSLRIEPGLNNTIALVVDIDIGAPHPFRKLYYFGECFYLTQPKYLRGRQFSDLSFVIFDEFEKAFAQSLLDADRIQVDADQLFANFKDILNSLQRNESLRFLYLGNITNLSSVMWDFLNITSFDFIKQINTHEKSGEQVLVLNLIPLFTNEAMSNYFEDLTTLGISEEELFSVNHLISEDNKIDQMNENGFIIFDDLHICYFNDGKCNIDNINMENMQKLNKHIKMNFEIEQDTQVDQESLIKGFLKQIGYEDNTYTRQLVPNKLFEQCLKTVSTKQLPVYCVGSIMLDDTLHVENKKEFFKTFQKTSYKFTNLREYFIYTNLIK